MTQAVPTIKLLIGGEFVESRSAEWRDIVNPATQEVLARVPMATRTKSTPPSAPPRPPSPAGRKPPSARARASF